MKSKGPLKFCKTVKYLLHYRQRVNTMLLSFPTNNAAREFGRICSLSKNLYVPGIGSFCAGDFKIHEQNIDPLIKFTATQNIQLSGWIKAKEKIHEDEIEDRKSVV